MINGDLEFEMKDKIAEEEKKSYKIKSGKMNLTILNEVQEGSLKKGRKKLEWDEEKCYNKVKLEYIKQIQINN